MIFPIFQDKVQDKRIPYFTRVTEVRHIFYQISCFKLLEISHSCFPYFELVEFKLNQSSVTEGFQKHFSVSHSQLVAVADPGFSPRGALTPKSAIIFQIFCRKLHENERIWTPGERVPGALPWIRQWVVIIKTN